ncbi:MAG: hypothetical protein ACRDOE_20835 [Streptosporangiaceae bacterium]
MARVLDCPGGITLSSADDQELFRLGLEHAEAHHPHDGITDDFVFGHIAQNARYSAVA